MDNKIERILLFLQKETQAGNSHITFDKIEQEVPGTNDDILLQLDHMGLIVETYGSIINGKYERLAYMTVAGEEHLSNLIAQGVSRKKDNINLILSFIAATCGVISIIITIITLLSR